MRAFIFAAILLVGLSIPGMGAESWPIADMNKMVDQTNFIVDDRCSGTLISIKEKLLLTNNHCIQHKISVIEEEIVGEDGSISKVKREKYDDVPVTQNHYKGFAQVGSSAFQTEIVARDKKRDLAILRFKQDSIPFTMAAPILPDGIDLVRGELITIVGNPALLEASVVRGEISSLTRQIEISGEKRDYIQVSGGMFGGNSGGALYNEHGKLIGVPAAGSQSATFIGLAIPVQSVKDMLRQYCLASVFDPQADDAKCKADKEKKSDAKKTDKEG